MVGMVISFLSFLGSAALKNLEVHLFGKGIDKENAKRLRKFRVGGVISFLVFLGVQH